MCPTQRRMTYYHTQGTVGNKRRKKTPHIYKSTGNTNKYSAKFHNYDTDSNKSKFTNAYPEYD